MTPRARIVILVGAVVALVVAFVVASGSSDDGNEATTADTAPAPSLTTGAGSGAGTTTTPAPKPTPSVPVVRVVGAKPQGGVRRLKFNNGDTIRFAVQSDTAD